MGVEAFIHVYEYHWCVCYKRMYYFQGVPGPSGPPGAKGIAGEPVSSLFADISSIIFQNKPNY